MRRATATPEADPAKNDPAVRQAAESFMDRWLEANIELADIDRLGSQVGTLARKCARQARKEGIALSDIQAIVGSIEEAITDEIEVLRGRPA